MIAEDFLLRQVAILLFSAFKFLLAAPASYLSGFSYLHTILSITAGGVLGVFFFFFLGRTVWGFYHAFKSRLNAIVRWLTVKAAEPELRVNRKTRKQKIFTRRNRMIIKIRRSFGFPGLVILTPIVFSIPLGTFLAMRYYSKKYNVLAWLSLSVVVWALILTTFVEIL